MIFLGLGFICLFFLFIYYGFLNAFSVESFKIFDFSFVQLFMDYKFDGVILVIVIFKVFWSLVIIFRYRKLLVLMKVLMYDVFLILVVFFLIVWVVVRGIVWVGIEMIFFYYIYIY